LLEGWPTWNGENAGKRMIRRTTWLVLAIFFGLFGLTWYLMGPGKTRLAQPTPTDSLVPLFNFVIDNIKELEIQDSHQSGIRFLRQDDGSWQMAGSDAPLDGDRLMNNIIDLATANSLGALNPAPALDTVGLNPPAYQIWMTLKDGSKIFVRVGALTPINNGYYVLLDDGEMRVASKLNIDSAIQLLENPPLATPVASQSTPGTSAEP
jgi:hypothetical protein